MNMMYYPPLRSRFDEKLQIILLREAVGKNIYRVDMHMDEHR
jgi:hypothetical protein